MVLNITVSSYYAKSYNKSSKVYGENEIRAQDSKTECHVFPNLKIRTYIKH